MFNFLRPKRDQVEEMIRDHHLRADQLARDGHLNRAKVERDKAEKLERRVLPKTRA